VEKSFNVGLPSVTLSKILNTAHTLQGWDRLEFPLLQLSSVEYVESLQKTGKKPKPTPKMNIREVSDLTIWLILACHL
jgi:hypothetical protein